MIRAIVFVLALLLPWPALAAAPVVALEVDVSALPDEKVTDEIHRWMTEHQLTILREGGIEISTDASRIIRVAVSRYGDGDIHYRTVISIVDRTTGVAKFENTITCELCRDTDLINEVGEELARVSGRLLYEAESAERRDEPVPEEHPVEEPPDEVELPTKQDPVDSPKAQKLGPWGGAGIASAIVGVGALGTGVYLSVRPSQRRYGTGGSERQSTQATGITVLAVGGAILVTGVALVTVDVIRRKQLRNVALIPMVTPVAATVGMRVRF